VTTTAQAAHRSAEQIGRTETGPRPVPPLGEQRGADEPAVADTVLPTGLRVLAVRRSRVPMVELRLRIPFAGSERLHAARAELLAETMFAGTKRRDRVGIDTELGAVGGDLGASVDPQRLSISGAALADGLPQLLDVLADALTGALHAPEEVQRERSRLTERLAVARSQPGVIAREALQRQRYGDHPAAREVPEVDDVAAVAAEDVPALHAAGVLPRGSTLVLVGDIDPDQAVSTASEALGGWESTGTAYGLPALPTVVGSNMALVHRPGAVQSALRLAAQAVGRTDERYPALQLANLAYGGFFSSRLMENLREDKGYTYNARSYLEFTGDAATLQVDTDVASEVTAPALLETRYELARMAVLPPNDEEVETVRRYLIGSLLISTSSQAGYASQLAALAEVGLGADWLREHPGRLEAVTRGQVAAAAAEFFAPSRFTGVVVGDEQVTGAALRTLGGVTTP
jgi:predicted Zn-dependent peptidase